MSGEDYMIVATVVSGVVGVSLVTGWAVAFLLAMYTEPAVRSVEHERGG